MGRDISNKDVSEVCAMILRIFNDNDHCGEHLVNGVENYILSSGILEEPDLGDEASIEGTSENDSWKNELENTIDELIQDAMEKIESL